MFENSFKKSWEENWKNAETQKKKTIYKGAASDFPFFKFLMLKIEGTAFFKKNSYKPVFEKFRKSQNTLED